MGWVLAFACIFAPLSVWAQEGGGNNLSVSDGVAFPGGPTAFFDNPAGIIYNAGIKAQGSVSSPDDEQSARGFGGQVSLGGAKVGAGAGFRAQNLQTDSAGHIGSTYLGIGSVIESLDLSIGMVASKVSLKDDPPIANNETCLFWCLDVGAILLPYNPFRIGFTAKQVNDDSHTFGLGVGYEVTSGARGALDFSYYSQEGDIGATFGLGLSAGNAELSTGYSMLVYGEQNSTMRTGLSVGAGYNLFSFLSVQFYFNRLARYYLSTQFVF